MRLGGPVVPLVSICTATPRPGGRRRRRGAVDRPATAALRRSSSGDASWRATRRARGRREVVRLAGDDRRRSSDGELVAGAVAAPRCGLIATTQPPARSTPSSSADRRRPVAQQDADLVPGPVDEAPRPRPTVRASSPQVRHRCSNSIAGADGIERERPRRCGRRAARRSVRVSAVLGSAVAPAACCRRPRPCRSGCRAACRAGPAPSRRGTGRSSDSQIARTVPCVAAVGLAAMPAAISCARGHSSSRARRPR